jgi:hypothetical protein
MKIRVQDLVPWAELVSAVAIVLSLIFVGLQINQNTRVSEINAYQDLINQISLLNQVRINNPAVADLWGRLQAGEAPRDNAEENP